MAFISLKVPESRHIVDSTLFHIALCASQFRVWNRYHIMTPVYVSVIYFCIRHARAVMHVGIACPRRRGKRSRHSRRMRTRNFFVSGKRPMVAWVDGLCVILVKIRQKKLKNLFTPSAIFFVTKFRVFVIMSKATSEVFFLSYQRNRTVLSFRERYRLTVLYQTSCGYDGTEKGFTKCDLIATKRTKLFFSLSEQ